MGDADDGVRLCLCPSAFEHFQRFSVHDSNTDLLENKERALVNAVDLVFRKHGKNRSLGHGFSSIQNQLSVDSRQGSVYQGTGFPILDNHMYLPMSRVFFRFPPYPVWILEF